MKVGTSFEYGLTIEHPHNGVSKYTEKYTLKSIEDDTYIFEVEGGPEGTETREGAEDAASGIFRMDGMYEEPEPVSAERPKQKFKVKGVKYYTDKLCGGKQEIWMAEDRIALRVVNTQHWAASIYREIRVLIAHSEP